MLRATDGLQVELHLAGASLTQLRHKPWIFRSATMSRCLLLDETIAAGQKKKKKKNCVCEVEPRKLSVHCDQVQRGGSVCGGLCISYFNFFFIIVKCVLVNVAWSQK